MVINYKQFVFLQGLQKWYNKQEYLEEAWLRTSALSIRSNEQYQKRKKKVKNKNTRDNASLF
jgi:hypothetical protein